MDAFTIEKEIKRDVINVTNRAIALKVIDNGTYIEAGQILLFHKDMAKKIKEYFKPLKTKSYDAWKSICNAENEELEKLQPGTSYLSKEMVRYEAEQEKKRQAEETRLRQKALKREENERLQAAIEVEKEGQKEEAEAILSEKVFVPPPIVKKTIPKINGLAQRTTWTWRVVDINKVPRQYLKINDIAVNQVVRALREKSNIPGIEPYPETKMGGVKR